MWHSNPKAARSPSRHGCDSKALAPGRLHTEARLPHVHACQIPTRPSNFELNGRTLSQRTGLRSAPGRNFITGDREKMKTTLNSFGFRGRDRGFDLRLQTWSSWPAEFRGRRAETSSRYLCLR